MPPKGMGRNTPRAKDIFSGPKKVSAPSFSKAKKLLPHRFIYNAKTLPAQPSLTGVHTPGNVEAEDVSFAFLPR